MSCLATQSDYATCAASVRHRRLVQGSEQQRSTGALHTVRYCPAPRIRHRTAAQVAPIGRYSCTSAARSRRILGNDHLADQTPAPIGYLNPALQPHQTPQQEPGIQRTCRSRSPHPRGTTGGRGIGAGPHTRGTLHGTIGIDDLVRPVLTTLRTYAEQLASPLR